MAYSINKNRQYNSEFDEFLDGINAESQCENYIEEIEINSEINLSLFKDRREKLNLGINQLCRESGVSTGTICRAEKGTDIGYNLVIKLDKFFKSKGV